MERERQARDTFFNIDHPSRSFPGFGDFPSLVGGRDLFDDPFFTRPFGSFGGGDPFHNLFRPVGSIFDSNVSNGSMDDASNSGSNKGVVIEELDSDDESELTAKAATMATEEHYVGDQKHKLVSGEPWVEHPDNGAEAKKSMMLNSRSDHSRAQRTQDQTKNFSVQTSKVTYGGVNGAYYTSSRTRSRGSDGVVLEESKEADRSTCQATHRISRGINDKGHSVSRKLNSDGKVDTVQTLHNLNEGSFLLTFIVLEEGDALGSWRRPFVDRGRFRCSLSG
ncbi:hypothetical protein CRG98_009204 [Punica granatum]|uniref:Myeloid leukemia factor 1 n=1 Tax=Punica granatum TaxID=22663 RepID=A0A2I0KPR5_PUNGR|nr:hypothetical protein CRG98_009204 [Punica granatum]